MTRPKRAEPPLLAMLEEAFAKYRKKIKPLFRKYSSNPSPKISSGTPRHHCAGSVIGQDAPAALDAGSDPVGQANAARTRLAASGYTGGPSV